MTARAALSAVLLASLASGCGLGSLPAPAWVTNRKPLPSCGEEVLDQEGIGDAERQTCLLEAFREGRGAELVTNGQMETGAPMTSYVRVHENGTVEMFLNLGDDPLAPGAWERFRCEAVVPTEPIRAPREGVFRLEGCEQLPVP